MKYLVRMEHQQDFFFHVEVNGWRKWAHYRFLTAESVLARHQQNCSVCLLTCQEQTTQPRKVAAICCLPLSFLLPLHLHSFSKNNHGSIKNMEMALFACDWL
jgi:hypothetical protein